MSGADIKTPSVANGAAICEQILGETNWVSPTEGFCKCPGGHLHSSPRGERDCKIYLEPVPTLTCFHASCADVIAGTNRQLRKAIAQSASGGKPKRRKLTPEQKAAGQKHEAARVLRARVAGAKDQILQTHCWPYERIIADSPVGVVGTEEKHFGWTLDLFEGDDVIWIGKLTDSGSPFYSKNFRPRFEWPREDLPNWQFICPSTFKPGSYERTVANVVRRKYLVAESDTLDKDTVGAVFRWMMDGLKLKLRCIVDTGGKSLHGWFDYPGDEDVTTLKIALPVLGCDEKMFNASQPCRLPGGWRNGKWQKFIYLDGGAA